MKVYTADYSQEEFIQILFGCDESLDPINNPDDYEFIKELIARSRFARYEYNVGTIENIKDVDIQIHAMNGKPDVVVGKDHVTEYWKYIEEGGSDEDTQTPA